MPHGTCSDARHNLLLLLSLSLSYCFCVDICSLLEIASSPHSSANSFRKVANTTDSKFSLEISCKYNCSRSALLMLFRRKLKQIQSFVRRKAWAHLRWGYWFDLLPVLRYSGEIKNVLPSFQPYCLSSVGLPSSTLLLFGKFWKYVHTSQLG